MKFFITTLLTLLLFLVTLDWGYCSPPETADPVLAVQEKVFFKYHELSFVTGYVSNDDFYEVFPVGLSYTFNFNDAFSWEVIRGYYDFTMEKDLMDDLVDEFGAAPEQFYKPRAQVLTHFVYRPLYGKDAVRNRSVINHETSFFVGGGLDIYEKKYSDPTAGSASDEMAFCTSFGAGIKYFINKNLNLSIELRDLTSFREDEIINRVWFGVNLGFRFNLRSRGGYNNGTMEHLSDYLRDMEK